MIGPLKEENEESDPKKLANSSFHAKVEKSLNFLFNEKEWKNWNGNIFLLIINVIISYKKKKKKKTQLIKFKFLK